GTLAPVPARPVAERFAAALALHRAGQTERARGLYAAVLADEPGHVEAVHMLGAMALQTQDWRRALILLREAGRMGLASAEWRANLAVALRRTGRTEEAATLLRALIAEEPRAEAHATLGGILADDGRFAEALPHLERAVTLDPRNALFRRNLGNALREAGRYEPALAELEQAVTLAPDDAEARIDRAHARLILGDYAGGFADYEWRFGGLEMGRRSFAVPRWDGYPFPGTLLVHGEQGLGDHIQFVRFVRMAAERCDRVLLEVRRPLMGLFGHLHPNVTVVEQGGDLPPFDAEVAILSLPHVLGLGRDGLGMDAPYLFAEVARIARWRDWLGRFDGLTVGLAWQGNPKARADKGRSPPLAALAPLFQVPGVRFVALQKEHGLDQLGAFTGAPILRPPPEFDAGPDAFLDSAAVMAVADLVVTSDTALAHLAGALARPTFLMLKHSPDWRWLAAGETSPWYPTMRLVRQPARGDWASVGRAVAAALAAVATP
ncbi:tetratricopeptide repeat protein, partial [Oharaeibacter diazotrophicus]